MNQSPVGGEHIGVSAQAFVRTQTVNRTSRQRPIESSHRFSGLEKKAPAYWSRLPTAIQGTVANETCSSSFYGVSCIDFVLRPEDITEVGGMIIIQQLKERRRSAHLSVGTAKCTAPPWDVYRPGRDMGFRRVQQRRADWPATNSSRPRV